jgi:hypothetical protein
MAQRTREQLNEANAALFVNNETGDITPDEERAFNEDVNDSAVNIKGDTFAADAEFAFQNGSKLREGIISHGYGGGIAKVCANDKTDQWEDGFRYLIQTSGSINTVVYAENMNGTNPSSTDDETKSYAIGSKWKNLIAGIEFVCLQANDGDAVWFPLSGEYTPVLGSGTGYNTITANVCQYSIVNDRVIVTGSVEVVPTSVGEVNFRIALPVTTGAFGPTTDASGLTSYNGFITAANSGLQVKLTYISDGSNVELFFTFQAKIIPA